MPRPELPSSAEQVGELVELLKGYQRALILTHDNPDPDSIAGAFCLSHLLDVVASVPSRILYGGIVGRSVNRQMVNALQIPMLTVEAATPTYDFSPDGATCEACGETVEIRWHDPDGGMVCADCKGW